MYWRYCCKGVAMYLQYISFLWNFVSNEIPQQRDVLEISCRSVFQAFHMSNFVINLVKSLQCSLFSKQKVFPQSAPIAFWSAEYRNILQILSIVNFHDENIRPQWSKVLKRFTKSLVETIYFKNSTALFVTICRHCVGSIRWTFKFNFENSYRYRSP
jgi:hypothetical protein